MSIRKQGIGHSIVNYLGVVVSFISTLFIYNLDIELYGFAQFLVNTANFLIPFMSLGVVGLVLKYYPEFKEQEGTTSFIKTILTLFFISTGFFVLAYIFLHSGFVDLMEYIRIDRKGILEPYFDYVVILAVILGVNRILTIHSSNLRKIIIPEVINNLGYKLVLPALILLGYYGYIRKDQLMAIILVYFIVIGLMLWFYLRRSDRFQGQLIKWKQLVASKKEEVKSFTFYSALNGIGASFAFRVDMIMLSAMLGFTSNGIYALLLFLSNVIDIPRKSLSKIVTPFLSTAAQEGDDEMTERLYQKASITLMVPSVFISILIYFLLPDLDKIVSGNPVFYENRYLFLFLALGRLVDMIFSNNTEIIRFSKYFKFNLPFIFVLAATNVTLNYFLINKYAVLGAALATFLAFLAYNLLKSGFLYLKMGISPFHRNTWVLVGLSLMNIMILYWIPVDWSIWISVPVKTLILTLFYLIPAYFLELSPDLNELIRNIVMKYRRS